MTLIPLELTPSDDAGETGMPIYEYACSQCGHQFETLVRTGTVPDCPQCRSTELTKKLSVFATAKSSADAVTHAPGGCASCPHAGPSGPCGVH